MEQFRGLVSQFIAGHLSEPGMGVSGGIWVKASAFAIRRQKKVGHIP